MTEKKWYKRAWLRWLTALAVVFVPVAWWLSGYYHENYVAAAAEPFYHIPPAHDDDTLRVIIVGDSWAEIHMRLNCDTIFRQYAAQMTQQPVTCWSRGKGGAMSKEIYHFMFSRLTEEHPWEPDRSTQPLIESHPDYCVLFAGINDAIFQRSTAYSAGNYQLMLRLLLHHGIRPVVMEIPMVDAASAIDYKVWYKRSAYHLKAWILGTRGNQVPQYREAISRMLDETGLRDSVLFIPANRWNPGGWRDTTMFTYDRIHLNIDGYHKLDSCIVAEILKDKVRLAEILKDKGR